MPVMEGPSSHSDPRNVSAPMRAMMLGGLAALSGVASNYLPQIGNETLFGVPPLPGVYFGAVVAVGIAAWTSNKNLLPVATAVLTFLAWLAAGRTTLSVHDLMTASRSAAAMPHELPRPLPYAMLLAGLGGGGVGSSLTAAAVALAAKDFRRVAPMTRTIVLGTVAGALVECGQTGGSEALFFHVDSFLPLFLVWQPLVAASIAHALRSGTTVIVPARS